MLVNKVVHNLIGHKFEEAQVEKVRKGKEIVKYVVIFEDFLFKNEAVARHDKRVCPLFRRT